MVESVSNNRAVPVNRLADVVSGRLGAEPLNKAHSVSDARGVGGANSATGLSDSFATQPIDIAHVEAIKAQIDAGTYRVDADQLAKDMLSWGRSAREE
ncbi:MAG: flagellar biosynthesis anti-sigma factor FlgM [Sphingopyxis sp.]